MEDMAKMITTYGLAVIISALVLYFAFRFSNIFLKDFEQKRNLKKHDDLAMLRNQISATINALLERTLLRTQADRVYVFEFHNGNTALGGLPFLKMTNTYEALSGTAKSEMHKRADMPFQLFQSFVDAVYSEDYLVMDVNNRTDKYSAFVYETLVEREISITIRARITDINKRVIGYFGIDYGKNKTISEAVIEESVKIVQDVAVELGALLSVNKK